MGYYISGNILIQRKKLTAAWFYLCNILEKKIICLRNDNIKLQCYISAKKAKLQRVFRSYRYPLLLYGQTYVLKKYGIIVCFSAMLDVAALTNSQQGNHTIVKGVNVVLEILKTIKYWKLYTVGEVIDTMQVLV